MSEQPDKNSPYHMPTPGEHLEAALKALDGATDQNWRERVEVARCNLTALDDWMGSHLLFSSEEPNGGDDYEPIPPGTFCGGLVPKYKTEQMPGGDEGEAKQ